MSLAVSLEEITKAGYVVLRKDDLMALMAEFSANNKKDARKKWITKKEAKEVFGVTIYWLKKAEANPYSVLKVNVGSGKTSTKTYHVDSIEKELERQAI